MPTFERLVTSEELFDLQQELYMLEAEQQLLNVNHSERIEEINELLAQMREDGDGEE